MNQIDIRPSQNYSLNNNEILKLSNSSVDTESFDPNNSQWQQTAPFFPDPLANQSEVITPNYSSSKRKKYVKNHAYLVHRGDAMNQNQLFNQNQSINHNPSWESNEFEWNNGPLGGDGNGAEEAKEEVYIPCYQGPNPGVYWCFEDQTVGPGQRAVYYIVDP